MPPSLPFVTIGIPCLNEEAFIEHTVGRALEQDYGGEIEVLVADGGSTDRTLDILRHLEQADPRVRTVHNPGRIQAAGMNEIIREARGDVMIRLDAHADYALDYVRRCVEVLERTGADNVGGAQRARAQTRFQRALCAAMDSPLGVGGAKYKSADAEGYVDTVWCGAFRRRVFEVAGMYDAGAVTNEDAELNQRILDGGGTIYLSPEIVGHYYPRDSYKALAKQYFRYGVGRARTLLKHRGLPSVRPLIPFTFVLGGVALFATRSWNPLTLPSVASYLALTGIDAVRVGRKLGWGSVPIVWSIFPVLHVSHGVGMGYGLVRYLRKPDWDAEPERLARRA